VVGVMLKLVAASSAPHLLAKVLLGQHGPVNAGREPDIAAMTSGRWPASEEPGVPREDRDGHD
jgi:hypothetical protein